MRILIVTATDREIAPFVGTLRYVSDAARESRATRGAARRARERGEAFAVKLGSGPDAPTADARVADFCARIVRQTLETRQAGQQSIRLRVDELPKALSRIPRGDASAMPLPPLSPAPGQ